MDSQKLRIRKPVPPNQRLPIRRTPSKTRLSNEPKYKHKLFTLISTQKCYICLDGYKSIVKLEGIAYCTLVKKERLKSMTLGFGRK
jgi:hypothetical protein